ncbi:2,3-dihydro-2,3-dihydroxybenzoate dehydrogenase [Pseudomonas sichuanensis]|uniref:2,3-dihydro-2,3-dihydroxybenzoate dehydrogenase n=1 Tax=Pseudomonas sichuanensis TaxID=2213015 RepID=UPI00244A7658|nr:2,3-dihydro-2,3-dihydroxybenzoate dehydrogenase [Pseudomonas sichuanensis]MDH0733431.1 2,3-dihydro-2,3-dihydroxybenzoate dehydrogenase [Pseudomonas sichuanensis]MDH1582082.1 2,3-dihydro-2,3-dihydroxybenzoate dehydrogenase [Pseudomonas sichuanensis]MDH1594141.1 2,3-dihydro-2,3-dihydroxybenzoate dehydrogenase [Pseudomonas sichuanensis]MDH1596545.1 2,3-dihydro-2,3-dihydroxybenzoate dehydrogenase [Pseudomonas sichuanensis]
MKRFLDKSVLVTGAARGIGAAVATRLLAEGATVIALDCDSQGLEALAERLHSDNLKLHCADITDRQKIMSLVERIDEHYSLDGLVNAAGVMASAPFEQLSAQAWLQLFEVNVHGTFHVSQSVARCMVQRRRGSIVSVASNAASTPRVNLSGYCASKAAVAMLTRCMGLELGKQGVRCNVVSPGSTRTPMLHQLAGSDATLDQRMVQGDLGLHRIGIPLGKIAEPQDIAAGITFLLSDDANHITLQDLVMDGGATFG